MNIYRHIRHNPSQCNVWVILLSYIAGELLASRWSSGAIDSYIHHMWLFPVAALAALAVSCYLKRAKPAIALVFLACSCGFCAYHLALQPPVGTTSLKELKPNEPLNIRATVIRIEPQQNGWRMDVELEQINRDHLWAPAKGKVRIKVLPRNNKKSYKNDNTRRSRLSILPGDHIVFRAKLKQPRTFGMPGEFNYPRYLNALGIFTTGYINDSNTIINLERQKTTSWRYTLERWRTNIGRNVEQLFPPQHSAYLLSLTLGQKSRLSSAQRDQLANCGISHLFSISGLHFGILAWLLYQLITRLYRRSEWLLLKISAQTAGIIISLPFLFIYLLLSGTALPTQRAALMIVAGALALFLRRHTPPITMLALVALIIVILAPLALFSAAFQLSFAGVGAILYFLPALGKHCRSKLACWMLLPFFVTLIATLATTPIALYHFHKLAPAAIICNLFAVPIIGMLTVPLALGGTLLITPLPSCATALLSMASQLINLTINMANHIASGPLAARELFFSPLQHLLIIIGCLALLLLLNCRWRSCSVTLATAVMVWIVICLQPPPAPLELTAFSIGQGDSLLLRLGNKHTFLIDGGGLYSKTFDVGKNLLAPALGHTGIDHFDAIILTHDHPDHRKGLIYILKHFSVDQFWSSIPLSELHYSVQQAVSQQKIKTRLFPQGWSTLPIAGATTLNIFAPQNSNNMNDRSLTLLASYKNDGILLTGDLESHGIEQLLEQTLPAPVNLLKLPHHGSRRSLPVKLMNTITPQFAIASVGYANRYGFPHVEVVTAVNNVGAQLIRTDRDGTVRFSSHGTGWTQTKL
ncbi:MAG: DNA internalization-related competence protein ComEC/Rec2 [Desulfobacteraceae bacterium 4572_35.1]|nr:MAG: DNA internalization-related competence protein ComEC/Rec2 [Desulfobacteraceae bacterium 4572_35.1]